MGSIEVSIIDAANPLVFVKAEDLGLSGKELPEEINADEEKLELLETVRGLAAVKLGLISDYKKSAWETPGIPKMTFVAEADDYITFLKRYRSCVTWEPRISSSIRDSDF